MFNILNKFLFALLTFVIPLLTQSQNFFKTNQNADLMLSGVGFNNSGGALKFNHPSGIATDGTRFLLCDRFNNRVLIWNSLPTTWNSLPQIVLGQKNFITNNSGSSKGELSFPGNVSVAQNGVVTVADTENDRILIWKNFPTENSQQADIVIELPKITSQGTGQKYAWPWGVWTDGIKLVATATRGSSILFWNSIPNIDNQNPDYTITNINFGTPRNISTDGSTYFFVGDHNAKASGSDRAGTFFWNSYPTQKDQPYNFYRNEWIKGIKLSDGKLIAGGLSTVQIWNKFPTTANEEPNIVIRDARYNNGDGVDVVTANGKIYVNNYNGNNVHVYNSTPTQNNQAPDFALSVSSIDYNSLDSINYIQNPIIATDGKILIATSDFMNTFWIWKTIPAQSGKPPDVKIQLRTNLIDIAPWDNELYKNQFVTAGKKSVAIWNEIPYNKENPTIIFKDKIGSFIFEELKGVALDSNYFYLAERNGKIGIWKNIPTTDQIEPIITFTIPAINLNNLHSNGTYLTATVQDGNPRAIYIYKVSDLTVGTTPQPFKIVQNSQALNLNLPFSAITFSNSLAIANNSNNQVLVWKNIIDGGDTSKVINLGQPFLGSIKSGIAQNKLFFPGSLAASDSTLWVGEFKFSSRILRFRYGAEQTKIKNNEIKIPNSFILQQNYPNPFNNETVIKFQIPTRDKISLKIYDLLGNEISTLVNEIRDAGFYEAKFIVSSNPSGIYFYKLRTSIKTEIKKMVLMK